MKTEKIYSPILDTNISKNINKSPIWDDCFHEEEEKPSGTPLICYTIKFDGLTPVQVTKISKPK